MVNDNGARDTSSGGMAGGAGDNRTFSRMALLLAFAGGAFAAWVIITLASGY